MQMQVSGESGVLPRMAELRLVSEREIPIQQHRVDSLRSFYQNLFDSTKSDAQRTIQLQDQLGKVKAELRQAEDALVKALAAKTRKEAKLIATMDSVSITKARVEELRKHVEDQKQRKDEYGSIIFQQSKALKDWKEQCSKRRENITQIEEAISWYNRVLGFRIESGHGVKFIFTNINPKNPKEEYSFVVRHANDAYTLLNCDPHLNGTQELVNDLNKSNGLFKFARTMREKFQEAAAHGISVNGSSVEESSVITESGPVASDSSDYVYESPFIEKGHQSRSFGNTSKGHKVHSARSNSLRHSSRLQGKN